MVWYACTGICSFCRKERRILRSEFGNLAPSICDVCSYAAREEWQEVRGQLAAASSPEIVRTYILLPRLLAGRQEVDVAAYAFLADESGRIPGVGFTGAEDLISWLRETFSCETWPSTLRRVCVGYDHAGRFSEVLLAWAWGWVPGVGRGSGAGTVGFAELLANRAPDAGFHLSVKTAFEALLWRREKEPEGNELCVFMREPTMRYLHHGFGEVDQYGDAEAMLPALEAAMSPAEREVADKIVAWKKGIKGREEPAAGRSKSEVLVRREPEPESGSEVGEKIDEESIPFEDDAKDDVPEGFARKEIEVKR